MRSCGTGFAAVVIATIAVLTGCPGSDGPAAGQAQANRTEPDDALSRFATSLSRRFDTNVLVDPEIVIIGDSVHLDTSTNIERVLDQFTHQVPNTVWRRVYITEKNRISGPVALASAV